MWLSAFLLIAAIHPARANELPTHSLFFTPEESKTIDALANKDGKKTATQADIHLGAIMYYGPDDWTLWLQGERWTPATVHDGMRILTVEPNQVKLQLSNAANTSSQEVTLRPYQTFHMATGQIIEGASE